LNSISTNHRTITYTNPLDAIREYVQNGVDARASEVTIQVTGNTVWILDDGEGMSASELHEARKFGVSRKSITEHVGFRGIGLYSGFDLCDRLRLTTKQAGTDQASILEFDFGQMKAILHDARTDPERPLVPLPKLLTDHTHFGVRGGLALKKSFTFVALENISDVHIRRLSNRGDLRDYVLRNLPIDFDEDFPYRDQINAQLRQYVKGYNPVKVILRSDGLEDEVIVKPNIPSLGTPRMELVRNSRGEPIAFYWACLTNESQKLGAQNAAFSDFEGLVYKVKGFTIGDRDKLKRLWGGKKILYAWYTGEVYVLDENVIPNTERDDFETNNAKRALEMALEGAISSNNRSLYNVARENQEQRVAVRRIDEFSRTLARIEAEVTQQTYDSLDIYSTLDDIGRKLSRYKSQAPDDYESKAQALIVRIDSLRQALRDELDSGVSVSEKKKLKTSEAPVAQPQLFETEDDQDLAKEQRKNGNEESEEEEPGTEPPTLPPTQMPSLTELFEEAGWELEEDCQRAIRIVQDALFGVLGERSQEYQDILEDIENRIREELEEE
jgi:hypothetical protein